MRRNGMSIMHAFCKTMLPQLVEHEPFECTAGSKGIDLLWRELEGPQASSQECGPHGRQPVAEL